jgi:hypothetical protein
MSGSTPAASTTNMFIINNLKTTSTGKAKKIATHKLFRIRQIRISTRHFEEPPPGKAANIFVVRENIRIKGFGGSESEPKLELKVWYLRILYGPEYLLAEILEMLRSRDLGANRSFVSRKFALGIESLECFVRKEPLHRTHECAFGVLGLESESVDPRL